jgi:hypothetical protein
MRITTTFKNSMFQKLAKIQVTLRLFDFMMPTHWYNEADGHVLFLQQNKKVDRLTWAVSVWIKIVCLNYKINPQ